MNTISLCMIIRDEESVLARCLDSVQDIVDEIIIVDTGSTDNSKSIARKYGARVFDFEWIDDFSKARNFAFDKATCDYIMWLDADDVIEPKDRAKLLQCKSQLNGKTKQVAASYNVSFDSDNSPTLSYLRERIFLRAAHYQWIGAVHECIPLEEGYLVADFCVSHRKTHHGNSERNIRIYERLIERGTTLTARDTYYYGRELYYHQQFAQSIDILQQFLQLNARIDDMIGASIIMAKCKVHLNDFQGAMAVLTHSFSYDLPRAEVCCELGLLYIMQHQYRKAIYWYKLALQDRHDNHQLAFIQKDCYDYIPLLQLCLCHDRLGEHNLAVEYNNRAATIKPNSLEVRHNQEYFESLNIIT